MDLSKEHLVHLLGSGLEEQFISSEMGCFSVPQPEYESLSPLLAGADSVLAFPYPMNNGFTRYRRFPATEDLKYWQPSGSPAHLYILPCTTDRLYNSSETIYIVEGEKKAASLVAKGRLAVGIGGIWNWKETDRWTAVEDLLKVPLIGRKAVIVPDNDVWTQKRADLQKAAYSLGQYLKTAGANGVNFVVLPLGIDKIGADDYFVAGHSVEDFDRLPTLKLTDDPLRQHKEWYESWKAKKKQPAGDGVGRTLFLADDEPCTV